MTKIIYADLDGTLFSKDLKNNSFINDKNLDALKEWRKNNYFGIATGRNIQSLKEQFVNTEVVANMPYVLMNGALIYDYKNNKILFKNIVKKSIIKEAINYQKSNDNVTLFMVTPHTRYALKDLEFNIGYEKVSEDNIDFDSILKITYVIKEKDYKKVIEDIKKFKCYKDLELIPSDNTYIEIVNKGINKGFGILKVLEELNIKNSNLYTIGDHLNDYAMIKIAEKSFAPSNAINFLKEKVNYVVSSNNESAIKDMIEIINSDN